MAIENVIPPFRFEGIHTAQLSGWDGAESFPEFQKLLHDRVGSIGLLSSRLEPTKEIEEEIKSPVQDEIRSDIDNSGFQSIPKNGVAKFALGWGGCASAYLVVAVALLSLAPRSAFSPDYPDGNIGIAVVFGLTLLLPITTWFVPAHPFIVFFGVYGVQFGIAIIASNAMDCEKVSFLFAVYVGVSKVNTKCILLVNFLTQYKFIKSL